MWRDKRGNQEHEKRCDAEGQLFKKKKSNFNWGFCLSRKRKWGESDCPEKNHELQCFLKEEGQKRVPVDEGM